MGAPNATATPAAVPMAMKSLLSASLRKWFGFAVLNPSECEPKALSPPPTRPPPCTNGPSFPAIKPLPMRKRDPAELRDDRSSRNSPFKCTPLRYVFISGMPLPAASGSTCEQNPPATAAREAEMHTNVSHTAMSGKPSSISVVTLPYLNAFSLSMSPSTVKATKPMVTPIITERPHFHRLADL